MGLDVRDRRPAWLARAPVQGGRSGVLARTYARPAIAGAGWLGGFKRSSQHSISRRLRWAGRRSGQRVRRAGRWSVRRGGRPRGGESIGCGSGPRSGVGSRAWRRLLRLACRRPLASDGSVRVAGCHLSLLPRCRGVTCRSPSGRRSLCCAPRSWGCARSPGGSVARRRRSRGSCAVTPGLAAAR